jgi:hypothetical protein
MKRSSSLRLNRKSTVAHYLLSAPLLALSSFAGAASPIGSDPIWLDTMGNTLLFIAQPASSTSAGNATLYRSDGTTAGTTQVAPIGGSVVEAVSYNTGALFLWQVRSRIFSPTPRLQGNKSGSQMARRRERTKSRTSRTPAVRARPY